MSDQTQRAGTATCLICDAPLSYLQQVQKSRFCGESCGWKHAALPPEQVCAACGRPLSPRELGGRVCASPVCQHREQGRRREHDRRQREVLQERARTLRDRAAEVLGFQEPETYTP